MAQHLVFYDGECGLCDRVVQFLLLRDKQANFIFAPLQGTTAAELLQGLTEDMRRADSLILIENYRLPCRHFYVLGKGALRICWLLGGAWTLLGMLSWLPATFYDWGYHFVAKNRHRLFTHSQCLLKTPENQHRFLP